MTIHDSLDKHWTFGLWAECPPAATAAWGARGIADSGCGFGLLGDRQTWAGSKPLVKAMSSVLNKGPLKRAIEEAKRLRDGWTPFKALDQNAFCQYWYKRLREEPELFEHYTSSGMFASSDDRPGYPLAATPKECEPRMVWAACRREQDRIDEADKEFEKMERSGKGFPVPDPPSACENDYDGLYDEDEDRPDDCEQKFKKVRGEWEGCYVEGDAWVCNDCGYHHYFDDDAFEDEPWSAPKAKVQTALQKIVGNQRAKMFSHESETFTLYNDESLVIKGNTNASHGYVYIIAYPEHDVVDADKVQPSSAHPGFSDNNSKTLAKDDDVFWSGPFPIPMPGDKVNITRPEVGQAIVVAHRVIHNYLHLITVPEGPLPEWWHEQNGDALFAPSETWNVAGAEIGEEIVRAPKEEGSN